MRKILVMLLVMVMGVSIVGCSPGGSSTTGSTAKPITPVSNKLSVWCWDPVFNIYAMNEAAKIYKETKPDFVVEVVEVPWLDVQKKLTTIVASGQLNTLPDIILMQDNAFRKNVSNYPTAFTDLTKSGIDFSKFSKAKVGYSVVAGKNYGVPFDNATSITALRTDLLAKAGLTIKDFTDITWDKFIELGQVVLTKTGLPMLTDVAGSPSIIMEILQSCGESLFKEDGSRNIVGNKALVEAIKIYTDMVKKGVLVPVNDSTQYTSSLNNGTAVGTVNGCWILGSIQVAKDQAGKWAVTNIPKVSNIPNATNNSNQGGSSWFVTSNCKNVALASDFFAKTFAGSTKFYETILPSSGALATYLPVANSTVYATPSVFFGGQAVFADITKFAGLTPAVVVGVYHYEARDAIGVAVTKVIAGANVNSEIQVAEDTVKFQMGK